MLEMYQLKQELLANCAVLHVLWCMFAGLWKCAEHASWTKRMLHTFVWVPSGVTYSSATIQEWFASGMSRDHNSSSSGFGCASYTTGRTSFWGIVLLYSVSVVFFCYFCKVTHTYVHTYIHTYIHTHVRMYVHPFIHHCVKKTTGCGLSQTQKIYKFTV